ncbi:MAG: hypothetical protein LBC87_01040 [Fibromonadaceae bacterium]|nr:hypothetical protein [Fibromonadaceae bacterium]
MKKSILAAFAMLMLLACSSENPDNYFDGISVAAKKSLSTFVDERDGKRYKSVKIGEQVWMAENLNYDVPYGYSTEASNLVDTRVGSKCYNEDEANCKKYGRLYYWTTAMDLTVNCRNKYCNESEFKARHQYKGTISQHQGICPAGWHLPDSLEVATLLESVGYDAGTKLKAKSIGGTDYYSFSALLGGYYVPPNGNGKFFGIDSVSRWWTTSEWEPAYAYALAIYSNDIYSGRSVEISPDLKTTFLNYVRCVQDNPDLPVITAASSLPDVELVEKCGNWDYTPATQVCENHVVKDKIPSSSSAVESPSSSSIAKTPSSSSVAIAPSKPTFTDERDGKKYEYVKIGTQTWMAENLNFVVEVKDQPTISGFIYDEEGSKCYNNDPANCKKYGALYTWTAAMKLPYDNCAVLTCDSRITKPHHQGICPAGWHIPSSEEWAALAKSVGGAMQPNIKNDLEGTEYLGGAADAGAKLKAKSGWNGNGNGTDDYGFAALPGGQINRYAEFAKIGEGGYWWSTTQFTFGGYAAQSAQHWAMANNSSDFITSPHYAKTEGYSVRCIKDTEE